MNMFEEAKAIVGALKLCKITEAELGHRMGVSQSYIANKIRLLNLPPEAAELIIAEGLTERHARSVLRLSDPDRQMQVLREVAKRRLTVRECEALVDMEVIPRSFDSIARPDRGESIDSFCSALSRSLDLLVSFGISARSRTSYYGSKMYITVCIDQR